MVKNLLGLCYCGNAVEGRTNHCATHNRERRKAATSKPNKRSNIKPVSDKRRLEIKLYTVLRKNYIKENMLCECCLVEMATQIHHKAGRTNDLLNDADYFLAVCSDCHVKIENHPDWAKKNGYSVQRTAIIK